MPNMSLDLPFHVEEVREDKITYMPSSEVPWNNLLCKDIVVVLNGEMRIMSSLCKNSPRILNQQQFTRNEWRFLITLISSYPYYTPYETLLAGLTTLSAEACRTLIQTAQRQGPQCVKRELKPVHRTLSSLRLKVKKANLGLKIAFVRDIGYVLSPDA